ncbi:MAG: hypothetical protein RMN52_04650 [Anaerolineae bacterium]|nr:hypothetical protein [Candidatus Roseilinea sp.]MDW8449271.1 hypothetical protein [Anaerolineae bacterium]
MNDETTAPTFAQLVDWVDGKLNADEAARVQAAAEAAIARGDVALAETLAWLRAFRAQANLTVLVPPPDAARAGVLRMFEEAARARAGAPARPGVLQRIIAALARVTGPGLAVEGARGAAIQARRRQMTFECDAADIVLNAQPRDDGYRLNGQILPRTTLDADGLFVELVRIEGPFEDSADEAAIRFARADALGEFAFDAVPLGRYAIVFVAETLEIRTAPFELD